MGRAKTLDCVVDLAALTLQVVDLHQDLLRLQGLLEVVVASRAPINSPISVSVKPSCLPLRIICSRRRSPGP